MATASAVCSLENYLVLPDHTMDERIREARQGFGPRCCGAWATTISAMKSSASPISAAIPTSFPRRPPQAAGKYIVFCGVHFMAESADVLSRPGQITILPDLNAGCSMADMAEITQVEDLLGATGARGCHQ